MPDSRTTTSLLSAVSRGVSRNVSPERQAERSAARLKKEQLDQELTRTQATAPTEADFANQRDIASNELKILKQQQQQTMKQTTQRRTFDAFDRYAADPDARHLTTLIQDLRDNGLPMGPLQDISRMDNVTEADREGLKAQGMNPDFILTNETLRKGVVRLTRQDGTVNYGPLDILKGAAGYQRYAGARDRQEMTERAKLALMMQKLQGDQNPADSVPEVLALSGLAGDTQDEREAARLTEAELREQDLKPGDPTTVSLIRDTYNKNFKSIVNRDRQTSVSRNQDEVALTKDSIDELAQNEFGTDFFNLDMNDPKIRRRFESKIQRVEAVGKLGLNSAEKKKFGFIKQLIAIGNDAGELTSKETGIIDKFSNDVEKLVKDKVKGVAATSAYSAYRNILRNALYGSVLTPGEMQAFKDQFGDLGQQTGPVLVQFRTALKQLKGEMEALQATNDSHVMHFRLGSDEQELQSIVDSLDERIKYFETIGTAEEAGFISAKEAESLGTQLGSPQGAQPPAAPTSDVLSPEDLAAMEALLEEPG